MDRAQRHHRLTEKLGWIPCSECGMKGVAVIVGDEYYCDSCYRLIVDTDGVIIDALARNKDPEMELALAYWKSYFND